MTVSRRSRLKTLVANVRLTVVERAALLPVGGNIKMSHLLRKQTSPGRRRTTGAPVCRLQSRNTTAHTAHAAPGRVGAINLTVSLILDATGSQILDFGLNFLPETASSLQQPPTALETVQVHAGGGGALWRQHFPHLSPSISNLVLGAVKGTIMVPGKVLFSFVLAVAYEQALCA